MMAILRSRAEICITSTSILHLTSTSGSHADTREASHPHLFHASLLSRGLTCAIVHSQRRKVIQLCNVLAFLLCETSDVHIMWAFIRHSSKSEIDTICNPSSLFDRPPLLCETDSLRLWPDVCLSPSWRRKTQTGSYLMAELGGEEGVDFQISDRDGTRLTMGGDELRDWRGQYGAPSQPSQRLAHTGDGCNLYGTHWIDEPHLSFNSLSSIQTHSTLPPSLLLQWGNCKLKMWMYP